MGKVKPFMAYDHKKELIDLSGMGSVVQMRPTEIHHKEDGDKEDKPVFAILMEAPPYPAVIGQISLKMFNDALKDIGYEIIKKK